MSSYGVTSGVTIHVTEKVARTPPSEPENVKITEAMIQEFTTSYHSLKIFSSLSFRSTLHVSFFGIICDKSKGKVTAFRES